MDFTLQLSLLPYLFKHSQLGTVTWTSTPSAQKVNNFSRSFVSTKNKTKKHVLCFIIKENKSVLVFNTCQKSQGFRLQFNSWEVFLSWESILWAVVCFIMLLGVSQKHSAFFADFLIRTLCSMIQLPFVVSYGQGIIKVESSINISIYFFKTVLLKYEAEKSSFNFSFCPALPLPPQQVCSPSPSPSLPSPLSLPLPSSPSLPPYFSLNLTYILCDTAYLCSKGAETSHWSGKKIFFLPRIMG